jgi:hypothetical protein
MKKLIKLPLLLITLLLIFSCSSEDSASCEQIMCYNNGTTNSDCGCDCPYNYTGIDCSEQREPNEIIITKVTVEVFPVYDDGSYWDVDIDDDIIADVYFKIFECVDDGCSTISEFYDQPTYFENPETLPLVFDDLNIVFQNYRINRFFYIQLFDYDNLTADDEMTSAAEGFFNIYTENNSFPETLKIVGSDFIVEMELSYNF